MATDSCKRRPVKTLIAEWDILFSLLRGQSQRPFPSNGEIKSSISKTETDIRRCDEEIHRLQAQIIALENEKRLIERNTVGYKSLLAPIRRLPPELLEQVFLCVCDDNRIGNSTDVPAATLTQVCSSWKNLATSSHCLWSTITWIHHDGWGPPTSVDAALERLLEKSGSVPLDINVSIQVQDSVPLSTLRMLVRQSHRWLRLSLCLEYQLFDEVYPALRPIQGNLPLLEHLEFDAGFQAGKLIDVFRYAPRLRSVKLSSESSPDVIVLPWGQLHSLVLCEYNEDNAPLIYLSSGLKTLTLDSRFEDDSEPSVEPSIEISLDVETFSLGLYTNTDHINIIPKLTFPALTSLSMFSSVQPVSIIELSPIQSLISRSSCTLTSLTWSNLSTPLEPFLSFLSTVPSLMSLSLSDKSEKNPLIGQSLFDKLQIRFSPSSIAIFLPNLQTLSLSSEIKEGFSDASVVDAVTSRWFPNGGVTQSLCSVRLETPNRCFTANTIPLQQLAQAGMKIVIKDQTGVVLC